jgi:hypothetical protein
VSFPRIPDADALATEVSAWEQKRSQSQAAIRWQFTTDDARIKLRRLYPQTDCKI